MELLAALITLPSSLLVSDRKSTLKYQEYMYYNWCNRAAQAKDIRFWERLSRFPPFSHSYDETIS